MNGCGAVVWELQCATASGTPKKKRRAAVWWHHSLPTSPTFRPCPHSAPLRIIAGFCALSRSPMRLSRTGFGEDGEANSRAQPSS